MKSVNNLWKVIVLIFILFIIFGCIDQSKVDYNFTVTKVVKFENYQLVTFANSVTYYTLWCPLEPEYFEGQEIHAE